MLSRQPTGKVHKNSFDDGLETPKRLYTTPLRHYLLEHGFRHSTQVFTCQEEFLLRGSGRSSLKAVVNRRMRPGRFGRFQLSTTGGVWNNERRIGRSSVRSRRIRGGLYQLEFGLLSRPGRRVAFTGATLFQILHASSKTRGDSAVADRDETDGADIQPPALKDRAKLIPPLTRRPAAELRDDACANPSNVLRRRGRWHPAYPALKVLG